MRHDTALVGLTLAFLTASLLTAQGASVPPAPFRVATVDGELCAGGPDYAARFDGHGVAFAPLLGAAAESVRFTLASVRRGSVDVWTRGEELAPTAAGNRVSYRHGPQLTELYEARVDGIEQSFVFAQKPAGTGDLVVCGVITTELALASATDDGVRYEREGVGGVTFGAVTGVDGNGATVRGSIRVVGDHVEWVLPAAFVDRCAYPLVLDPLIGSAIGIGDSADGDDHQPSVAFDDATGRYLVVWNQSGVSQPEIHGRFVAANGTALGSAFLIAYGNLTRQAVANINGTNRFLVTFSTAYISGPYTSTVRVVAVNATTGATSNVVFVETHGSGSGVRVESAVVGGDSRTLVTADSALVVYERIGVGNPEVRTCVVHVPATGDPFLTPGSNATIATDGETPSVTAHGGNPLRWLVTWKDTFVSSSPHHIYAGMVGTTGSLCAPAVVLHTSAVGDGLSDPVCAAADGTKFLVAWHTGTVGVDELQAKVVTWSGACGGGSLAAGPLFAPVAASGRHSSPAVAFAKSKFLLAWVRESSPGATPRVFVKGLDPVNCASCGAEWSVENTLLGLYAPAIASRYGAGETASDEALVVWSNDSVRGRRFEATGNDVVTSMGGGCGSSGFDNFATYNGDAVLGNLDFELALASPTLPVLALVIGLSNVSIPCGPCTLVPALDIVAAGVTPNPLPIPCDLGYLGVDFYAQWLLFAPGGCSILPDFALSNALKFTIGE